MAGTEGRPPGTPTLPESVIRSPRVTVDRQCHNKSTRELARGHSLQDSDARSSGDWSVGRGPSTLPTGGTHLWSFQHTSLLAEQDNHQSEWQLHPDLFLQITSRLGQPQVDLFASPTNAQLPQFCTKFQTPGAEGTNALCCLWPQGLIYAFPPTPLIPRVVRKVLEERAEVLLIAPYWPNVREI